MATKEKGKGRRCSLGCESWPNQELYAKCPYCGEETKAYTGLSPLTEDEAASILRRQEFERYYARYCALNGQSVEGDLPPESDSVVLPAPC
jgi:hypothetical protein